MYLMPPCYVESDRSFHGSRLCKDLLSSRARTHELEGKPPEKAPFRSSDVVSVREKSFLPNVVRVDFVGSSFVERHILRWIVIRLA